MKKVIIPNVNFPVVSVFSISCPSSALVDEVAAVVIPTPVAAVVDVIVVPVAVVIVAAVVVAVVPVVTLVVVVSLDLLVVLSVVGRSIGAEGEGQVIVPVNNK